MAQMIRDDFQHIDYMTILIGYNDYNGEGISAQEYGKRLQAFLETVREKHRGTNIFCITPTFTKTPVSKKSGVAITEFRKTMIQVVEELQGKGYINLFLIRGEELSKVEDLKDAVHFNVKGAKSFGELLTKELRKQKKINKREKTD
jgi:lysophospholipase L1-like esterase